MRQRGTRYRRRNILPPHWIGVRRDWQLLDGPLSQKLVSLTPEDLATHCVILAATGAGKTILIQHLIAQAILRGISLVVLDLRGDLVLAALELCAGHVDPSLVLLLDLREKGRPMGFNPLGGSGEPYFRALQVLEALEREAESWGVQLAETLRNALLLMAEAGLSLTLLEAVFTDRPLRRAALERVASEAVHAFWKRFDALSPDKQAAQTMPVLNKASLLLCTDSLRRVLGHPAPIDLKSHLDTPGSVSLVSLAVDELHGAGRMMGQIVLGSVLREIFSRVGTAEAARNPVQLFVDEFENFPEYDFETILAEGRRFKLSTILAFQALSQVSPKMRSLALTNVGCKVVLRTGREDGAVMSKDLFGDPKAYDFSNLPTGTGVLWRRQGGPVEIEVNEPLIPNGGSLSPDAAAYRSAVLSAPRAVTNPLMLLPTQPSAPPSASAAYRGGHGEPAPRARRTASETRQEAVTPAAVEEWL